uniref:Uncharacterized protein n=1 Tax=Romanomermis culicivorax TaxID=13658 RepID=A0A915LAV1_ROMCU
PGPGKLSKPGPGKILSPVDRWAWDNPRIIRQLRIIFMKERQFFFGWGIFNKKQIGNEEKTVGVVLIMKQQTSLVAIHQFAAEDQNLASI